MLMCFTENKAETIAIVIQTAETFATWLATQDDFVKNYIASQAYHAKPHSHCLLPDKQGALALVLVGDAGFWTLGHCALRLPSDYVYHLGTEPVEQYIVWGLGAYQFTRYKPASRVAATLYLPTSLQAEVCSMVESIYLVRDLINTPAEAMGPQQLADCALQLATHYQAHCEIIKGEALQRAYPAVYAVGRASPRQPQFIKLQWGHEQHPKVALVGKGVCFDTGGLDLKSPRGMIGMKKDMGGGAHVLGLAKLIMAMQLPLQVFVYLPAVENAIGSHAFRPSDVITTRKGLTVEVGNTDAEGRLILADALAEATEHHPDLLIDFATLTGAARVAVGDQIAAYFSDDEHLVRQLQTLADQHQDPMWRLPLYQPYRQRLDSPIAALNNVADEPYGGATIAALFLQQFIPRQQKWLHIDLMAANIKNYPGRPQGGEAMGLRAVFAYLKHYGCG